MQFDWTLNQPGALEFQHHWKTGAQVVRGIKCGVYTNKHEVCFMIHIALKEMDIYLWYLDSGYSRHMIGGRSLFKTFELKKGGNVYLMMEANLK